MNNFGHDIKDSEAYAHLIHQIAPKESGVHKNALGKSDLKERAEETLEQADKIGCRSVKKIFRVAQDLGSRSRG